MTSRITETVALAAIVAGAATGMGVAEANATEGNYGRIDLGYSFEGEAEFESSGGAATLDFDENWVESIGMGHAFAGGLRLEGEFAHRFNEMEPSPGDLDEGDFHVWSAMGNAYFDFNRGGVVQPYVGVGVGVARLNVGAYNSANPEIIYDDDTSFAYQGMVGVGFQVTDRLNLDVGYKYFTAENSGFNGLDGGLPQKWNVDYTHQAATVGIRWQFGDAQEAVAPPPPAPPPVEYTPPADLPPPPVAACPTMEFVVYFEWDRSNVNDAAFDAIDAALSRARECNLQGISVVGHTDTSGAPAYNVALSERRASAVRDALVARGVSAYAVRTEGRGEADLSRPTRDGVREPLNRRATITLNFGGPVS